MNWQDIKVSADGTHFLYNDKLIFGKKFIEVLKFHSPGLAPVKDETGAFHINGMGGSIYQERYTRTFGYYCNRATIVKEENWYHITEKGERVYAESFSWAGNYQEDLCTVRGNDNRYFHINLVGQRIYSESYTYCGDFKDGYACVRLANGFYRHIDSKGAYLNKKQFTDLGIFHKKFATAKDENGWFHIDKDGEALYQDRFLSVEPFYNGFALVQVTNGNKIIIDENGIVVHKLISV